MFSHCVRACINCLFKFIYLFFFFFFEHGVNNNLFNLSLSFSLYVQKPYTFLQNKFRVSGPKALPPETFHLSRSELIDILTYFTRRYFKPPTRNFICISLPLDAMNATRRFYRRARISSFSTTTRNKMQPAEVTIFLHIYNLRHKCCHERDLTLEPPTTEV